MAETMEYKGEMESARRLEADGFIDAAKECRNDSQWAAARSLALRQRGEARARLTPIANGEAVPGNDKRFLRDTLMVPDLAAVEASLERSRLLLNYGTDVAAMAIDAAVSIKADNSLEKMLAHQLTAAHKTAMEQLARAYRSEHPATEARHLTAALRAMATFQKGLLSLRKLRQDGQQRITVQYVNVSDGSQAIIGK
jgi:hypothetical protein